MSGGSCLGGIIQEELSGVKSPGSNCPGGNFMGSNCPGGSYPRGTYSGAIVWGAIVRGAVVQVGIVIEPFRSIYVSGQLTGHQATNFLSYLLKK